MSVDLPETIDLDTLDPDNLPDDPAELLALLQSAGGKDEGNPETEKADDNAEAVGSSPADNQDVEEEAPILSADGKHQIPFAVLKQEREARRYMAEENSRLQQELEALRQAQAEGQAAPAMDPLDEIDPDLAALEEEFPEIAKLNQATRSEIQRLRQEMEAKDARLAAITSQWEREQQAKHQAAVEQTTRDIDGNSVLRYLRDEQGPLWSAAVEIDNDLQQKPAWAGKPQAERFAEVVERLEKDFGPVQLPQAYQTVGARRAAKPKVEAVEDQPVVHTLSDLKGGSGSGHDEMNLENTSTVDIQAKLMKMTRAEQDAWLARL